MLDMFDAPPPKPKPKPAAGDSQSQESVGSAGDGNGVLATAEDDNKLKLLSGVLVVSFWDCVVTMLALHLL